MTTQAISTIPSFLRIDHLQKLPDEVMELGSIQLEDKIVPVKVESFANITATHCWVQRLEATGQIALEKVYCEGKVSSFSFIKAKEIQAAEMCAVGDIEIDQATVTKGIKASGELLASNCPLLGPVSANGLAKFAKCESVESIQANGPLTLRDTKVLTHATTLADADVVRSTIEKTLTCAGKAIVKKSKINTIDVKTSKQPMQQPSSGKKGSQIGSNIMGSCGSNCGNVNATGDLSRLFLGGGVHVGSNIMGNGGSDCGNVNVDVGGKPSDATAAQPTPAADPIVDLYDSSVELIAFETPGKVFLHGSSTTPKVTNGQAFKSA